MESHFKSKLMTRNSFTFSIPVFFLSSYHGFDFLSIKHLQFVFYQPLSPSYQFHFILIIYREFFEKVQSSIQDLAQERDKSVGASKLFLRAMLYPFFRVGIYATYFSRIAEVMTVSTSIRFLNFTLWNG